MSTKEGNSNKQTKSLNPPQNQLLSIIKLYQTTQFLEAENLCIEMLDNYPRSSVLYGLLGQVYRKNGKVDASLSALKKAININPNYEEVYHALGNSLRGLVFQKHDPELHSIIIKIMNYKRHVRPQDISRAVSSLLKVDPVFARHLNNTSVNQKIETLLATVSDISNIPLLLKILSLCPIDDLSIEKFLRQVRAKLLFSLSKIEQRVDILRVQSALALQCFTNEYIWGVSTKEKTALAKLEASVLSKFQSGEKPSAKAVLCLASYKPLHIYEWSGAIEIDELVRTVVTRQITEPKQEETLKSKIPSFGKLKDLVSVKVAEQYEQYPYPRWVNTGIPLNAMTVSMFIKSSQLKLADNKIINVLAPDILVAGCGTGQQAIGTASRFKNSKVLSIDLSRSSLAYAKRKTSEYGFKNVEYIHGDIADLHELRKSFDIIECVGVLHHMNDPTAGWKAVTSCLKTGGLMKIGLYSEIARRDIVSLRNEINRRGVSATTKNIIAFRESILSSMDLQHRRIRNFSDFYSLSELRDLLFHVQEKRFNITQIKENLISLGLVFCGFENSQVLKRFQIKNSDQDDLYDLDKWQKYEDENPDTFANMYQFWCQKIV